MAELLQAGKNGLKLVPLDAQTDGTGMVSVPAFLQRLQNIRAVKVQVGDVLVRVEGAEGAVAAPPPSVGI